MPKALKKLIVLIIIIFALSASKDILLKNVLKAAAAHIAGAPVEIDGFTFSPLAQRIKIKGLRLYNPKDFPKAILASLGTIEAKYDLGALIQGKLHLPYLEVDLEEAGIMRSADGKLNADSLKVSQKDMQKNAPKAKQMPLRIDELHLKIGRIIYTDYANVKNPIPEVFSLNIMKKYHNINSANQLAVLIISEPMKSAGIKGAGIYAVAAFTGVAALPLAAAVTFAGKDSISQELIAGSDEVYDKTMLILEKAGKIKEGNREAGIIKSEYKANEIAVKISRTMGNKTNVVISARKYLLPQKEISAGVLYLLEKELTERKRAVK